jgi:serine/threonine-protein kinase
MSPSDPNGFEPGAEIDGYVVEELIGEGAAAVVYRARDARTGLPVTLKVPRPSVLNDGELRRRFRREARLTAAVQHPNVQRNIDDGRRRSTPYLVLSHVEGHNLRTELRRRGGAAPAVVVADWAAQLSTILTAVHGANVLHRDVKPENIVVDPSGALHLVDFGDATRLDRPGGRYHILSGLQGTPEYLSPEQILGRPLDARTDLYSVGVVLYEALSGRPPFRGADADATLSAHLSEPVPDLRSVRADIPPWLATTVHTLLRRRPSERPADGSALRAVIDAHVDDRPPAPPDPPMRGSPRSATARALVRFVVLVACSVIVVATTVIVLGLVLA